MRFKIYDETFNLKNQKFSILPGQNIKLTSKNINYSFLNKNYTIKLKTSFHYLKTNNVDGINHKYIIFDKETHYVYAKKTFYKNSYHNSKIIVDNFEMSTDNINKIKLQIDIFITNLSDEDRNLELNNNYMTINCFENYDFSDIYENKNNISTNLIKINTNEDNIASNLNEINYLKNNKSSQYLKNVYNILFNKTQVDFRNNFYNKTFELNASKNDFIEINLRMLLDYENINESHLVFTAFKLINDDDDELYIATYHNKDNISYKNFVFTSETIFYNFEKDTKKLKILIYFRKTDTNAVIKIWYKPVNTDRMIIKHFGN